MEYNSDTELYELKYISIDDYNVTPVTLNESIDGSKIISLNNSLYVQAIKDDFYYYKYNLETNAIDEDDNLPLGEQNYYSAVNNLYFLIDYDSDSSTRTLQIIDAGSKDIISEYTEYISHSIQGNILKIYTANGIEKFGL